MKSAWLLSFFACIMPRTGARQQQRFTKGKQRVPGHGRRQRRARERSSCPNYQSSQPRRHSPWCHAVESGTLPGKGRCLLFPRHGRKRRARQHSTPRTTYPLVPFFAIANRWSERVVVGFSVDAARTFQRMEGPYLGGKSRQLWQRRHCGQTCATHRHPLRPVRGLANIGKLGAGVRLFGQYVEAIDESDITTQARLAPPWVHR